MTAQALVQSTDLSAYFTESNTKTLFWVNSLKTGKAVADAQISINGVDTTFKTDASGVVTFDTVEQKLNEDTGAYELQYYTVSSGEEKLILVNSGYRIYWRDSGLEQAEDYWRYFQTDRSLYKPDDLVQFWGFLQNRYDGTSPSKVTLEIAQGGYWGIPEARFLSYFLPSIQKPLVTISVSAENGFFDGSFQLPKLSPGGYQITVKLDDTVINSHYITVENYVKPAYKMTVGKDKKAIFLGETVNFTITPAFFDGTPLPFLDVSYNLGGYSFENTSNTVKTGTDGKLTVPFTAKTNDDKAQGEQYIYLNANASLPESGMIRGFDNVRVFINDIYAAFESETDKDGKTTLKATVNEVDLTNINSTDKITEYPDYKGKPVANKTISGSIIYHWYEKIEDGEEYDYINKVVNKRYRYEERRKTVESFSFKTDEKGIATKTFTLNDPKEGYYTAELTWQDGNGRKMTRDVYLSNYYVKSPEMLYTQYDWYHLKSDKDKYRLGDDVTVTFMNNEEAVSPKSVLFMEAQRGITNYKVQSSAEYKTKFEAASIPNFYIGAVQFTGKTYISAGFENIRYDTDAKKIDIQVEADKDAYRPGDTVTVKITAKDENGKPVAARINLAIIDEAMLEISHQYVNVLDTLYQWLGNGVGYSYASHNTGSGAVRGLGGILYGAMDDGMAVPKTAEAAPNMNVRFTGASYDMDEVQVRSDFRDTALFRMAELAEDGTGTVSFKLPDNVTSWKVTLAGISPDLYGGTGEASLKVTLPFFINDSLNTTYLTGDFPYLGVTSYGNDLKEGEIVTWQITSPQMPDYKQTATGKAFERTNIPLWQFEAGVYDIEIKAITDSGLSDGIKRTIRVVDTYHEIEEAVTETLKANMTLKGGEDGLTTLIFTDKGRGKLVPVLYSLLYSGGSRLDQKYIAYQAKLLLDEIAPDRKQWIEISEVDLTQYQKSDGGYGILPYSESDAELSALLATLLKDEAGAAMLKQYYYSLIFAEPGRVNTPALYGLAVLGEPVLVNLNDALKVQNLGTKDSLYLALAFEALGEDTIAHRIYHDTIKPKLENKQPYIRVKDSDDTDVILKNTALAAVLASRLDIADKEGLFQYVINNYSRKVLVNAEKLLAVLEEYKKLPDMDAEFTYEYDGKTYTESLKDGGGITVTIPSTRLSELKITKVTGEASVVSVFEAPLVKQVRPDETLTIKRTYYDYKTGKETTEFKQNDIVKVVLDWDIAPTAMDSFYEITDFAPSGLKPIENPYQAGIRPEKGIIWWFRNTDGQKVTFNVYRDSENKDELVYYARVVSPGTFKADSTIIQGTLVKDSMKLGESTTIKIAE
ncbi:MAG: alpha-2-macroglobulin, partial [Ruminiclostridium sp.]|nr:alpha-2-macroglobulin [Ruminiclostridium sp.]